MLSTQDAERDQERRRPRRACCQSSYGLIANWKMITGRFAIGAFSSVLQNWLLSAVNSSGAVSPADARDGEQDAGDDAGARGAVA